MNAGNIARDKGQLMLTSDERDEIVSRFPAAKHLIRRISGSNEVINGPVRYCLWIQDQDADLAERIPLISDRLHIIRNYRATGSDRGKLGLNTPYKFERTITGDQSQLIIDRKSVV